MSNQKSSQSRLTLTKDDFYGLKIISDLYKLKRTGWVDRDVKNPETVGEHSDELIIIANNYFPHVIGLSTMLKIHDWPEADISVGDRRTDIYCPTGHRISKEEKKTLEFNAMQNICSKLKTSGNKIMNLWLEYEEGKTERAKIAYQIDKLQAILKAIEYEKIGEPVIAKEFIQCNGEYIKNRILKNILKQAML